ncbi:hypothetical protein GNF86_23325 [Clostridium perfringens]
MDKREELDMAATIQNDKGLYVKLLATGMLLNSAKVKMELYMSKSKDILMQMHEDESYLESIKMYYLEEAEELLECAEESMQTSYEVEKLLEAYYRESSERE